MQVILNAKRIVNKLAQKFNDQNLLKILSKKYILFNKLNTRICNIQLIYSHIVT